MQGVRLKKYSGQSTKLRTQRDLRNLAIEQGIPQFLLRLATVQQVSLANTNPTPRYRHD